MSRVYFEGWFSGCYATAEDWYKDNLIYVNVKCYYKSTAISRPDKDKSFLLKLDNPERVSEYKHSIVKFLESEEERRDAEGRLIPLCVKLPPELKPAVSF